MVSVIPRTRPCEAVFGPYNLRRTCHQKSEPMTVMVGAIGFEPMTPCAQGRCATRLRYAPTLSPY
jgi:hypothetical protein